MSDLPKQVLEEIIRHASPNEGAFLVGGQALTFWAERYSGKAPELANYRPYTTKDVDFYGTEAAARKLAASLSGSVRTPSPDDHTPQTAIVEAIVLGHKVSIDFLGSIKGPPADQLEKQMVAIRYPLHASGQTTHVDISVMHPLHCLQSRAANVIGLHRKDEVSRRQLNAAPIVLREYISEALGEGYEPRRARVAASVLNGLTHYLLTDPVGVQVHKFTENNPLEIIKTFRNDIRFDERNREHQIQKMIADVSARQMREQNRAAQAAMSQGRGA